MMDDSIEAKALALINEERAKTNNIPLSWVQVHYGATAKALCRTIERHEAFKQEVSDAVEAYSNAYSSDEAAWEALKKLITPKPKLDPLAEAMLAIGVIPDANSLRAALDALGFEIREKGQ
jgi:hypothetical protein